MASDDSQYEEWQGTIELLRDVIHLAGERIWEGSSRRKPAEFITNAEETLIEVQHACQERREAGCLTPNFWNKQHEVFVVQKCLILDMLREVGEEEKKGKLDCALKT